MLTQALRFARLHLIRKPGAAICRGHKSLTLFLQRVRIARNAMQSAVLARGILSVCPSVRLSVRPSRSGIVSRRMKIRSCGFQHLVGQSL